LHLTGGPADFECPSCGRLDRIDIAAITRAGIVQRSGFSLDGWEKVIRDREADNLRPALLQRLLKVDYETAASWLGRAHRLGLLETRSDFQYRVTRLPCHVCQVRIATPEGESNQASQGDTSPPMSPGRPGREPIPAQMRFRVLTRDNFRCRYCGRTANEPGVVLHLDHVIPVSNGGETTDDNLMAACNLCNLGKSNKAVLP
jgi:5-methylcytosine-specific restriction endonuclease McrA